MPNACAGVAAVSRVVPVERRAGVVEDRVQLVLGAVPVVAVTIRGQVEPRLEADLALVLDCLLYTSPSPRD